MALDKMIAQMISDHFFNEETKDRIVKGLNENINITIIGEDTEEKILSAIYDTIEDVMKKVILAR